MEEIMLLFENHTFRQANFQLKYKYNKQIYYPIIKKFLPITARAMITNINSFVHTNKKDKLFNILICLNHSIIRVDVLYFEDYFLGQPERAKGRTNKCAFAQNSVHL